MHESRSLPHSLEAEMAVLGAVLMSPETWPVAASLLTPEDFYRQAHAIIFESLRVLHAKAIQADLIILSEELKRTGALDEVGGPTYLWSLTDGVPKSSNVAHYAAVVREHKARRQAIQVATDLMSRAFDAERPAAEIVEDGERALHDCLDVRVGGLTSGDAAVREYAEALASGTIGEPMLTGYTDFDRLTGGLRPKELAYVAARPSSGKTSFGLGIARHVAKTTGKVVPFFSLEMTKQRLAARMLSWRSGVSALKMERGQAEDHEYAHAWKTALEPDAPTLQLEDTARTVTEIWAWCKRARREGDLACVVIDYFQLMIPERKNNRRDVEVAYLSESLKHLAKDLDVTVLALSQLSRAPETRRDKRPMMSDLRESGALEQDADMVLLLFREEMYRKRDDNVGVAECIVAKNRNGPIGTIKLQFDAGLAQFRNLARQEDL